MIRFVALLLLSLAFASPVLAQNTSTDPKHAGFTTDGSGGVAPIYWKEVTAECDECDALADSYNDVMAEVFHLRYEITSIEALKKTVGNVLGDAKFGQSMGAHKGLGDAQQEGVAMAMNAMEEYQTLQDQIPVLRAQVENLETLGADLRSQLQNCEATQCADGPETPRRELIGDDVKVSGVLPFDWNGPYPEVCHKCAKLSARLNELPTLARVEIAKIEIAKAEVVQDEAKIARTRAAHTAFVAGQANPDANDKELEKLNTEYDALRIDDLQKHKKAAESRMRASQQELDRIKKNFEETLALYNTCVPTCQPDKKVDYIDPGKKGGDTCLNVTDALRLGSLTIGPNAEYGTSAQTRNKVKDMATGAAMGALGGVLGGGRGLSMGGGGIDDSIGTESVMGGGGGGAKGPNIVKDPLGGDYVRTTSSDGFDFGVKAGFTDDGLVISQKIFDSPNGDSTFHATWLEDALGRKLLPSRYYIYSIYVDHKLTVWWTYDHWTDGVHDYHDEGEEVTEWRTNLGDFKVRYGGEEGVKNSLWYQSGFDTAVKGVKSMGAIYSITPEDLVGTCPKFASVTHLTLPDNDPVITWPVRFGLNIDEEEAARKQRVLDAQIHMTPF